MDDRLALLQAELGQHAVELVGAEDAHQVVFEREEELRAARIALTAGAAAQLVVDAAALVALGAEHEQPAGRERRLLQPRDLLADRVRARIAHARLMSSTSASSWRMRMSALPPSWMSVPRPAMLVAMVIAPGTPACDTI